MTEFQAKIVDVVDALSPGEVVSFGDVAARAGRPGASRAVGATLSSGGDVLPWWRVVYSSGHLPPCNPSLQAERLTEEGVTVQSLRVVDAPLGRFHRNDLSP